MKRILVIGSGGAGKTTFTKLLSKKLSLPVIHLDAHYWKPGWTKTPTEQWHQIVNELCNGPEWVMDGNFASSLDIRLKYADAVIFLDYGRILCTYRVMKRLILHCGKVRDDMGEGCPESFDLEFIKWVWSFRSNSRPRIISSLSRKSNSVAVHFLKNKRDLAKFLEST